MFYQQVSHSRFPDPNRRCLRDGGIQFEATYRVDNLVFSIRFPYTFLLFLFFEFLQNDPARDPSAGDPLPDIHRHLVACSSTPSRTLPARLSSALRELGSLFLEDISKLANELSAVHDVGSSLQRVLSDDRSSKERTLFRSFPDSPRGCDTSNYSTRPLVQLQQTVPWPFFPSTTPPPPPPPPQMTWEVSTAGD